MDDKQIQQLLDKLDEIDHKLDEIDSMVGCMDELKPINPESEGIRICTRCYVYYTNLKKRFCPVCGKAMRAYKEGIV